MIQTQTVLVRIPRTAPKPRGRKTQVLEIAKRLVEIDAEIGALRDEKDVLEAKLDALIPEDEGDSEASGAETSGDAATMFEAVTRFLTKNPGQHDVQELCSELKGNPDTVRSLLSKLAANGQIRRSGRGLYEAIPGVTRE